MKSKVCGRCGIRKDIGEFNRRRRSRDGFQPFCRACDNATSGDWHRRSQQWKLALPSEDRRQVVAYIVLEALYRSAMSEGRFAERLSAVAGVTQRELDDTLSACIDLGDVSCIEFDGDNRLYSITPAGAVRLLAMRDEGFAVVVE